MGRLTPLARQLRVNQTEAEKRLWGKLRNRRLDGWKFRRQVPIGNYIADFLCPDAWLIVELDGGQHGAEIAFLRDSRRTMELEQQHYFVLRFWNNEVLSDPDAVCETILRALQGKG